MKLWLALLLLLPQDDLRQGLAALNRNDLPHARESLERAARTDPQSAIAWVALAQTYIRSGEKDLALQAAARAEQSGMETPPVQHALALLYRETGDLKKAAACESRYIASPAATPETVADLGQALLQHGNFAEALDLLDAGQRRFPKDPQIVLAWGVACYTQRRPEDAVAAFLQVIRLDATIGQPYVFLGRILEHAGDRLAEVIEDYAHWEEKEPDNYLPVFLHAKALLASASPDTSSIETLLRRSIRLNEAYWESHLELGTLLAGQGKWTEAEHELTRSIELNSREPRAHYDLARVYLRLGKPAMAKAERTEYERLKNAEPSARVN